MKRRRKNYFSKEMVPLIICPFSFGTQTYAFIKEGEKSVLEDIIAMVVFDLIILGLSIWVIKTIWDRNEENQRNKDRPSGKSRIALIRTGWLLIAIIAKIFLLCCFK